MLTAREVQRLSRPELAELLAHGHPVSPDDVAGFGFRGVSLGLPSLLERLTWTTFQKAFVREGNDVRGWNVKVEQRGASAKTTPKLVRGVPHTFGHFRVAAAANGGLLLDYGAYAGRFDPLSLVRDPVVAVNAGSSDLLLGMSYLDLGLWRANTPSYFTLEREAPVDHVVSPS